MNIRTRNTLVHLGASVGIAGLAWLVIGRLWYPAPLAQLAGGTTLFLILVGVDVALGPMLTAVVSSAVKPRSELRRDLALVVILQAAALGYGVQVMARARPVAVVFEMDLFRVVSAADIDADTLSRAPTGMTALSWTGPRLIAAVKPTDAAEQLRTIELALAGIPLAALPQHWRSYGSQAPTAWAQAVPASTLQPATRPAAAAIAADANVAPVSLRALPLLARGGEGTVVLTAADADQVTIVHAGSRLQLRARP